jgi:phytoene dehydrogenase-like protein
MPDAVVIGAGPNGLVAANNLADHGWSVAVFEAQPEPGGAVRSGNLIEPGYTNDLFSSFYPLGVASPHIGGLGLEVHGLSWRRSPLVVAHPSSDDTCPSLSQDLDQTMASLDSLCPGDGEQWRKLYAQWQRIEKPLLAALMDPFPPVRAGLRLATSMPPLELLRFARFGMLPARRMGLEHFEGDAARRLLAGNALHAALAPEAAAGGIFGWIMLCLGQSLGWPVPEGGAGSLTAAMVKRLASRGVSVTCDARVDKVIIRNGRAVAVRLADGTEVDATRAVVADVVAPTLYLDLVGPDHMPAKVLQDLRHFEFDDATFKVDWNLDAPIPWIAEPARRAGTIHVGDSLDELTMTTAQIATGQIPDKPFLLMGQQSMTDPTRQPAGKETAWAYTHVPQVTKGDAGGTLTGSWDKAEAETFADRVEHRIEALAPGFRDLIRGRHIFTPFGLQEADENLQGGAINGGTAALYQQLVFRPTPGFGRSETPVAGLFLGSFSAHPGGGVHGACGANAAKAAIAADRRRQLVGRLKPSRS